MVCKLLENLFSWALTNEKHQPAVNLNFTANLFEGGLKSHQLLAGTGAGLLIYTSAHVVQVGQGQVGRGPINLLMPPSFGGQITYTPEKGANQKVDVQILAVGNSYNVTFHPSAAAINGSFVPTCYPAVAREVREGNIIGFMNAWNINMFLSNARTTD